MNPEVIDRARAELKKILERLDAPVHISTQVPSFGRETVQPLVNIAIAALAHMVRDCPMAGGETDLEEALSELGAPR